MRCVMPAIVPHSDRARFMAMARFETGPGGNPHYHDFSMGTAGPVVRRVKADVAGAGDEAPRTVELDKGPVVRAVRRVWEHEEERSEEQVLELVRGVLVQEDAREGCASEAQETAEIQGEADEGGEADGEAQRDAGGPEDVFGSRVR